MRVLLAFVVWIFNKVCMGLVNRHKSFKTELRRDTGVALIIWLVSSLLSSLFVFLILLGVQFVSGIQIPIQVWFTYMGTCLAYLVYTAFNLMYNAFKAERRELFETIKNGK